MHNIQLTRASAAPLRGFGPRRARPPEPHPRVRWLSQLPFMLGTGLVLLLAWIA